MKKLLVMLSFLASTCFAQVPGISAKSYIVTDLDGNVLLEHNASEVRSIASITKLLVAEQVFPIIESKSVVRLERVDFATHKNRYKANTNFTEDELLRMALISSSNPAIYALARAHNTDQVVANVNTAAQVRGLSSIKIEEPSGLNPNNVATATDLAKFLVINKDNPIANISTEQNLVVKQDRFNSTNPLLGKPGWTFVMSKTGFINAAGGCVATLVEIGGQLRAVVILGSANVKTRWVDLIKIRSYLSKSDNFWQFQQPRKKK